jgi:hypothetical protein
MHFRPLAEIWSFFRLELLRQIRVRAFALWAYARPLALDTRLGNIRTRFGPGFWAECQLPNNSTPGSG